MKRIRTGLLFLGLAASVYANPPHIGYAYPAGGQQGSTLRVMIGGQYLQNTTNVFMNAEGVSVDIVKFTRKYEAKQYRRFKKNIQNAEAALEKAKGENILQTFQGALQTTF